MKKAQWGNNKKNEIDIMQNTSIVFDVAVLDKTGASITVIVTSRTRLFPKREG